MQGQYLVAIVGKDNKIAIKRVQPGHCVDSDWIMSEGLKPGEQVVAEGVQKVKEGLTVNRKPFVWETRPKTDALGDPESNQEPTTQPGRR
jgi:membrane fusion protein (multidrug efflux system)